MRVSTAAAAQSTTTSGASADQLSSSTFLTLLTTQLKNQDPLEPMSGSDMLAQISQLTTVEQLMNLNTTLTTFGQKTEGIAQVSSLLGKKVEWLDAISGKQMSGTVTRAQSGDSGWQVKVGNNVISVDDLLAVE